MHKVNVYVTIAGKRRNIHSSENMGMDEKTGAEITFDTFFEEVFSRSTASEVLEKYATEPAPDRLFGEIWREGEFAVLFGEAGTGKSILATQIADAAARGRGFGPFETDGGGRRVLYFDLKLGDRQWAGRYSEGRDEREGKRRVNAFPARFDRVGVNAFTKEPDEVPNMAAALGQAIGRLAKERKASVVVIDDLDMLRRSNDFARDILPLVRELRRLKAEQGLSILAIVSSVPMAGARSVGTRDLRSARVMYNFADSVFAMAPANGGEMRYLKQLKSGSDEILYDTTHTVTLRPGRQKGTFPCFEAVSFRSEEAAREGTFDKRNWELVDRVKELRDNGRPFRKIAAELNISKTTAHRLYQVWEPPPPPPPKPVIDPKQAEENARFDAEFDARWERDGGFIGQPAELDPIVPDREETDGGKGHRGFPKCGDPTRYDGLEYTVDHVGRDIWVSEFREHDRKPKVWFYYDSKGRWCRAVRSTWGVDRECLEPDRAKYVEDSS